MVLASVDQASAYTLKSTSKGARVRWFDEALVMRIDSALDAFLEDGEAASAVHMAIAAWKQTEGVPEILVRHGDTSPVGYHRDRDTNGFYLHAPWTYDSSKLAVTVTTYEEASGRLLDADVLVNPEVAFALMPEAPSEPNHYDLPAVMAHEIGHVVGLGESEVDAATMWPYIRRGETRQRVLHDDDRLGAATIYAEPFPEPAAAGCGPLTIAGRHRATPTWMLLALAALLGGTALALRKRGPRSTLVVLGGLVLFAPGLPVEAEGDASARVARVAALDDPLADETWNTLAEAVDDPATRVRASAIAKLERFGAREHRTLALQLAADRDPDVRAAARRLAARLMSAPPVRRVSASDPTASLRADRLFADAREVHVGTAHRVRVEDRDGLLWTVYQVRDDDGGRVSLTLPGGTRDGITQQVGEAGLPAEGHEVMVARRFDDTAAWAYHRHGLVYGGVVGDGPAIDLAR